MEKRATFKEAGIEIPTADHSFKGAKQTGWVDSYGNPVDENTLVTEQISYMSVYAKYDKTPVNISRNYLNQDGEPAYDSGEMYFLPENSTYGDLKAYVETLPAPEDSYQGLKFQGWKLNYASMDVKVITGSVYVTLTAVYDKNVYSMRFAYLNDQGDWTEDEKLFIYDAGTTYGDMYEEAYAYRPASQATDMKMEKWAAPDYMLEQYRRIWSFQRTVRLPMRSVLPLITVTRPLLWYMKAIRA